MKLSTILGLFILLGLMGFDTQYPSAFLLNTSFSEWVFPGPNGKLQYKETPKGDRIMDFSQAGYGGGGVNIPHVKTKVSLKPMTGDNTQHIQSALDAVGQMPLVNGFRGAVELGPGNFPCQQTLFIKNSGVVLRGSGQKGTIITMTGKGHPAIVVSGLLQIQYQNVQTQVADAYIPSGVSSFKVTDARNLKRGDRIQIIKPVTPEWVQWMGMDTLVRNEKPQTWISGELTLDREIQKIIGNQIFLDVPLPDNYDAQFTKPGTLVRTIVKAGGIENVGLEDFQIRAPDQSVTISEGHHSAFRMQQMTDGWARNLTIENTVNSVSITGSRITIDRVRILHASPTLGAAKPADLNGSGTQILFNQCFIQGDNLFFFGTGAKVTGPNVLLNCVFKGNGWIQPHQRWATGLLVDGCQVPDGGIDFMNRGVMGSGHGWTIGWAVAWNSVAKSFLNQQPPGAYNWVIGGRGLAQKKPMPFYPGPLVAEGIYDHAGNSVQPTSLYLSQLKDRLGSSALINIGY